MWANTVYIMPSLIPRQVYNKDYIPNGRWYDLRTEEMVLEYDPYRIEGVYKEFDQPLGYITFLIKGWSLMPYQHLTREAKIRNTKDSERTPSQILIAPDNTNKAIGSR